MNPTEGHLAMVWSHRAQRQQPNHERGEAAAVPKREARRRWISWRRLHGGGGCARGRSRGEGPYRAPICAVHGPVPLASPPQPQVSHSITSDGTPSVARGGDFVAAPQRARRRACSV